MATLYKLNQYISKTLNTTGGIDATQTTDIELPDVTGIDTDNPGIALLSYTDPLDTDKAEWITYTSIVSATKKFSGVTRGAEGYTAKVHAKGVTIAFPISKSHINNLNDLLDGTTTGIRANKRVVTTTDDATAIIDVDITDVYELSAVANATEFTITGTPTDGQFLQIRYKDAGVAKGLTFTGFTALGATIPTTTTAGKWETVLSQYNSAATQWHVYTVNTEA